MAVVSVGGGCWSGRLIRVWGEGGGVWGAMVRGHCWGVFRAGDNGVVVLRAFGELREFR